MNHTKKMVLVSFDQYQRLTNSLNTNDKVDDNISGKSSQDLPIITKDEKKQVDKTDNINIENTNNNTKTAKLTVESILSHFSKQLQNKARLLLQYIETNPLIDWSEHGELIIEGKQILDSHVIDILKYLLIPYKNFKPNGSEEIIKHLANVPKTLLKIEVKKRTKQETVEPPPGEPDTKRIRLEQNNIINPVKPEVDINNWKKIWTKI